MTLLHCPFFPNQPITPQQITAAKQPALRHFFAAAKLVKLAFRGK
jgi:hypothetical protein